MVTALGQVAGHDGIGVGRFRPDCNQLCELGKTTHNPPSEKQFLNSSYVVIFEKHLAHFLAHSYNLISVGAIDRVCGTVLIY